MNQFYGSVSRLLLVLCTFFSIASQSQTTLTATGSSGSGYPVITAAGFAHENPDCVHGSFGPHVTQAFDAQLNKNVFVFHSHIVDDNDRCTNLDRVRMEIKGNNSTTQHTEGQTAYYRWKFKLDANFIGGSSFCHIFQIKAYTGDAGAPLITITPRASVLEIIHDGGDEAGSVDLGKLTSVDLAPFKGVWVEAYVKYTSSDNGSFEITLKRVSDGATLLSYSKTSGIDMWRTDGGHNRPKWGVYRSKNSTGLRDEQVRFADFCVSESSASQCPSDVGSGGGGTFSGYYRLTPRHSGKALVVQSASTANSAAVIQYTYGGSATNDEWELLSIGSGYYRIINRNSAKDMVVQSASTSDGATIFQYTYGGSTTNDEWQLVDNGDGYYRIVNRNSGKVAEVAGSSTADGAAVQQRTWNGGTNQQFQLVSLAGAREVLTPVRTTSSIQEPSPTTMNLRFQNPTSGSNTVIDLALPEGGATNLTVFDQAGRAVAILVNGHLNKGNHRVTLDHTTIAAGTYILRLVQKDKQVTRQLIRQ
ncbi:T9SS C-terminal target domain-containing protein [Paraflavitalea soli]|uniref:T9SS C-terminal target domain-containing protein n=1 Tax=Paraflavitalea soli TaxID=2315862 RepID=A0A3B7MPG1_9BACT|nr:RICIN domain-containing protein [Paraflavitalea soli]AXY72541.1 T9SS C-terminal target domain-containing protein [Paraflavitalea soli]